MPSAINLVAGDAPSRPARTVVATIDFAAIISYATGGHVDTTLDRELVKLGASVYHSLPMAAHNGAATRYFKVNPANGKVMAFTTASLETEVSAATDLSGYTAIPVVLVSQG